MSEANWLPDFCRAEARNKVASESNYNNLEPLEEFGGRILESITYGGGKPGEATITYKFTDGTEETRHEKLTDWLDG